MTKEEIIELAKQAGFERLGHTAEDWVCHFEDIEEFTKLVAEKAIKEALAQPEQEPVAWDNCRAERMCRSWCGNSACASHYADTTTPQREFVGLTDEEKHAIRYSHMTSAEFIEVIEAKLKEKNTS